MRRDETMTEELQEQSTANEAPEEMPDEELLYDLADLFKIFSDTTRIKILYALMGRELSVSDSWEPRRGTRQKERGNHA